MSSLRQGGMYPSHREVRPCFVPSSAVLTKILNIPCIPHLWPRRKQSYHKILARQCVLRFCMSAAHTAQTMLTYTR